MCIRDRCNPYCKDKRSTQPGPALYLRHLPRETLIKLSLSTANAATVSADEAEDTGNDEWIRALQQKDAAGIVFGRDGAGGALGQAMRADRALLPDGG